MNKNILALVALAFLLGFAGAARAQEPIEDADKRRVPYYYGQPPYWPNGQYRPNQITIYNRGYTGYVPYSNYPVYITPPTYYQRQLYVPLRYTPTPIYNPYAPVNPAAAGYYWRH